MDYLVSLTIYEAYDSLSEDFGGTATFLTMGASLILLPVGRGIRALVEIDEEVE